MSTSQISIITREPVEHTTMSAPARHMVVEVARHEISTMIGSPCDVAMVITAYIPDLLTAISHWTLDEHGRPMLVEEAPGQLSAYAIWPDQVQAATRQVAQIALDGTSA